MVSVFRPQPHARSIIQPEALSLWLFGWDLQPFTPPYACNPFEVYMPTLSAQQCCDPSIAIPAILTRKADDRRCQSVLIISDPQSSPLRRPRLAHASTSPAFGNTELLFDVINKLAAALRA
jgi:hypothetical protein